MSHFAATAKSVQKAVSGRVRTSGSDRDSEWQRVNSYIADVLKDAHVLFAKLARLQGDFGGSELDGLEKISEDVLDIGGKLSAFSKSFYEGKAGMAESENFGEEDDAPMFGGSGHDEPAGEPGGDEPAPAPAPAGDAGDVDVDFDYSGGAGDDDDEGEDEPKKEESEED